MIWQTSFYVYLMSAAGAVSLLVAALTSRRRRVLGWRPLVAISCIGALWALTAALELSSGSLTQAVIFHKLSFVWMEAIGVAWFVFAAVYAGHDRWASPKRVAALSALPAVTLVLVWTNAWHGLVFRSLEMQAAEEMFFLRKAPAIWWYVDSAYTYCLLVAGIVVLGSMFLREFGLYRRQVGALIAGVVVPMAADIVYVSGQSSSLVNTTPALFAWVGLTLYWGFIRYRLLDLAPVAREFVTEHMSDALVVLDPDERVTYINLAAEESLATTLGAAAGRPLEIAMAGNLDLLALYREARDSGAGALEDWQSRGRYYDGRISLLNDRRGRLRGSVLVLRDATDRKVVELALDEARRDLENRVAERTAQLATEKEHLAHLYDVAVEIAKCTTSAEIINAGVRLACRALGARAGALWVPSNPGGPESLGSTGVSADAHARLLRALQNGGGCGEEAAEALVGIMDGPDGRIHIVPLVSRGLNLGCLCLAGCDEGLGADGEVVHLASAVTSQIAVALENARRFEEAQFLAERDSLTLLLNHRGFSKRLEQEVALGARSDAVFSLVMIDVDGFKLFNDAYGHVMGDRVLQEVARLLNASLRRSDVIARYGGDEFVVALPDTDAEAAVQLVERFRTSLDENPVSTGDSGSVPLKMSYGVATFPNDGRTAPEILAAADANLYRSKRRGGDFITASGSSDSARPVAVGAFSVLDGLVTTVDKKDHYTRRHADNATEHTLALAAKMGLSLEAQRSLRVAALLHDVGKIGVPDHILRKPAGLTEAEFETVKTHVPLAELIIQGIPNHAEVLSAVTTHHERYDGQGYPNGLAGGDIPLLGRILAVTDAYSAMTIDRPYRKALPPREAKAELKRVAGTQLDPEIVKAFLEVLADDEAVVRARVAVSTHGA